MEMTACSPVTQHHKPSLQYSSSNGLNNSNSIWLHTFNPCRPSLRLRSKPNKQFTSCLPASTGPPSPPEEDQKRFTGIAGVVSRFQDRVQIFFAVLFWMSLFFWASASDGKNSGRPGKGSRSRR